MQQLELPFHMIKNQMIDDSGIDNVNAYYWKEIYGIWYPSRYAPDQTPAIYEIENERFTLGELIHANVHDKDVDPLSDEDILRICKMPRHSLITIGVLEIDRIH